MNSERSGDRRIKQKGAQKPLSTLGNLIAIGGLIIGSIPLFYPERTDNVLATLFGAKVDCADGVEPLDDRYPFDAIAVPGGGIHLNDNGEHEINLYEDRRLRAAAIAYLNGYAKRVILLDGEYAHGINPDITKDVLQRYVSELSEGEMAIPNSAIHIDSESIDTASNARELSQFVDNLGLKKVLLITDEFHVRAEIWACANDIKASWLSVEEIEMLFNTGGLEAVDAINNTPEIWKRNLSENLKALAIMYDPTNGYLTTKIKQTILEAEKE